MRNHLEDQQTHIRTGLNKLVETQDQVDKLRGEMEAKSEVLKVKDAEANAKLTIMVEKQNEAEQRKTLAEQLTVELEKQNAEIKIRREAVEQELSEAEPTLQAAKQSVSGIKKTQLDEVRALNRPPPAIQKTMEMVCIMIGEKNTDWTEIRKIIRRDDFISTVVNFDPMKLNSKQVKTVKDDYLNKSDIDYASVDRASKACGPLYKWAESQIKYATILRNIQPLREELAGLQAKSDELSVQQKDAIEQVGQLEAAIKQYKMEYATAIRDTETIRTEMETVSSKVSRALSLLTSLGEEKVRWSATSASFDEQMSTLIGDNLIAAAFLTYGGIFDHKIRRSLMMEWSDTLEALGIPFLTDFDTINYLSSPADHITWRDHGLPNDDLATENAILLERFNRFPLVVDPSGQATNFILNKYAAEKIVQSSFLDAAFMKTLASAIRFGTPLLVHDVEYLDPILNPVLNKEIQKTGGRSLIRIGSEEIDFSPRFMLVLVTRNPTAKFSPDLCSRVTMINFTVTPASLESQALSAILKAERPDVDRRRNEILRLQSEQSAKMRHLQEALLTKISQVQGAILDDDSVIKTLEKIKAEAQQLTEEVTSTKSVMEEVKSISNTYVPLASAMATVYFSLESLSEINFLYKYSLQFFLDILSRVLKKSASEITTEEVAAMTANQIQMNKRIKHLKDMFFAEVSRRTLRGLKYEDKLLFAVRLAQISTHGDCESELTEGETDLLLRGSAPIMNDSTMAMLQKFKESLPTEKVTESMTRQLLSLSLLPAFSGLLTSITSEKEVWLKFLEEPEAERHVPISFIRSAKGNPLTAPMNIEREALLKVLLVRALRQERVIFALEDYVNDVFKLEFDWRDHCNVNLKEIVEIDSKSSSPLMLCSAPGQDASGKVDLLSTQMGAKLLQVSMGSAEGYAEAERSISTAAKQGNWVLLRNVHLCPEWLKALEKRVHGISSHENFRLFLTCEIHPKLPAALLRMSEVLIYEASTGVKANIQRFYNSIPASRIDKAPAERGRLYGLLAWFNAVVQERLRYAPLGWTKKYEFSEADTNCSLDVIDQWVDQIAGDRRHVNPADLPWEALQTMLSQSLYGGRVDHPFDQVISITIFLNGQDLL